MCIYSGLLAVYLENYLRRSRSQIPESRLGMKHTSSASCLSSCISPRHQAFLHWQSLIFHIHFKGLRRNLANQGGFVTELLELLVKVLPLGSRLWLCLENVAELLFYELEDSSLPLFVPIHISRKFRMEVPGQAFLFSSGDHFSCQFSWWSLPEEERSSSGSLIYVFKVKSVLLIS